MVGMFASFFEKSPKQLLVEKVEEKRIQIEEEKKQVKELEE